MANRKRQPKKPDPEAERRAEEKLRAALRWPDKPKPTPMSKEEISAACKVSPHGMASGWFSHANIGSLGTHASVTQGYSSGVSHARDCPPDANGDPNRRYGWSQGHGRMFKTREEAILDAQWSACEQAARALLSVWKFDETA